MRLRRRAPHARRSTASTWARTRSPTCSPSRSKTRRAGDRTPGRGRRATTGAACARPATLPGDWCRRLPPRLLGDVVVCARQALRQARAAGTPLAFEIAMLLVHGTLHVLGYDHEADAGEMALRQARHPRRRELGAPAWPSLTTAAARSCRASTTPSRASSTSSARSATCGSTSASPIVVLVAAFFFELDRLSIVALFVAISFVFITEMLNTALEYAIDIFTDALRPAAPSSPRTSPPAPCSSPPSTPSPSPTSCSTTGSPACRTRCSQGAPDADRRGRDHRLPARRRGDRREGHHGARHAPARRPAQRPRRRRLRRLGGGHVHRRGHAPTTCRSR